MIICLTGDNDFLLGQTLRQLTKEFVQRHGDIGLEKYDGESLEPQRLPSILQAPPFLAEQRMVVLDRPSAQKVVQENLEKLLPTVVNTTCLVIVEPKLDKRTSYYKALRDQTDFRQFGPLHERELVDWLVSLAKASGGSLSVADARYLVSRVGQNQLQLSSELQKLLDYQPAVNRQTIDLLTEPTPQSSIFDLLAAAFDGQAKRVLQLYHEQRQQKVEPLNILALAAWQLHILALIKTAGERSPQQIASQAKLSPFVVSKSQAVARRLSLAQLKQSVERAARLDQRLKSQSIDADEALLEFLLTIS